MQIDFLCCGEYIQATAAYSNAVLTAILPYVSDFSAKLNLPIQTPVTPAQVERFMPDPRRGEIGGGLELKNGAVFGFQEGYITIFESPRSFFKQQDPDVLPKFYAPLKMTETEAVDLARQTIRTLGHSLEDVLAELPPTIEKAQGVGTNIVPHFRIVWKDPRGGNATEIEVNGNRKVVEAIRFSGRETLRLPAPVVDEQPAELPVGHPLRGMNELGQVNPAYAEKLVPIVFQAINDWNGKLGLNLPSPITTNYASRFYVSDQGGWPHVEVTLTNGWAFKYRNNTLTYAASPKRFFDGDKIPFRLTNYVGHWKLTDKQAIDIARKAVAKLGYPADFVHTEIEPRLFRPEPINGIPSIPRIQIEWNYPNLERRTQWIVAEIDCDKGTVESLAFDDVSFWGKPPPIDVPISRKEAKK